MTVVVKATPVRQRNTNTTAITKLKNLNYKYKSKESPLQAYFFKSYTIYTFAYRSKEPLLHSLFINERFNK